MMSNCEPVRPKKLEQYLQVKGDGDAEFGPVAEGDDRGESRKRPSSEEASEPHIDNWTKEPTRPNTIDKWAHKT